MYGDEILLQTHTNLHYAQVQTDAFVGDWTVNIGGMYPPTNKQEANSPKN